MPFLFRILRFDFRSVRSRNFELHFRSLVSGFRIYRLVWVSQNAVSVWNNVSLQNFPLSDEIDLSAERHHTVALLGVIWLPAAYGCYLSLFGELWTISIGVASYGALGHVPTYRYLIFKCTLTDTKPNSDYMLTFASCKYLATFVPLLAPNPGDATGHQ